MTKYNHLEIEKKWQKFWAKDKTFKAKQNSKKPKYYALDMFPYPSGAGLHVGHPLGYTATDIISRKRRMEGYNVLHPMGWDAFGLPAENFAIKTGVHPEESTNENIKNFTRQIKSLGFSYDWSREINTTDLSYYKWSQWLFLQFYKKGLLYESAKPMNWCPSCKVVCANEEVEQGLHERCGNKVERKNLKQWMFRITKYADRLLKDLDKPNIVLLHGWGGNGDRGWFKSIKSYLKENNIDCLAPSFPNTENPVYQEWKDHFEKEVLPKINEKTIILAHSLGGGFIQRYLTEEDLHIAELVLVAPTVGDCGIPEIKNLFENKKKRGCVSAKQKCYPKGNKATPSLFDLIVSLKRNEVKKKRAKKPLKLSNIKDIIKTNNRKIIFDGEILWSHFLQKNQSERRSRSYWGLTVLKALKNIEFNENNIEYFLCRGRVFLVILSQINNENFIVKSFYQSKKLTKFYQENKNNLDSLKFVFDYEKIKNSADNIFIYGGGDDHYIKAEEFEFLARKLSAHFDYDPKRTHMGQCEFERNEVIMPYFEKLVAGILDWPDKIRAMQRNWIGKSEGAEVDFLLEDKSEKITVFTTRPDTLFGATYFVLSPEHPLVKKITTEEQKKDVEKYKKECAGKSDMERTELNKDKTGVFTGGYVINPVNNKKIPVWIADYVLMSYGTGAIMAVPAHDERDLEFAEKYNLPIIEVVGALEDKFSKTGGALKNSDFLNGLSVEKAISKILEWLEENKLGKRKINYKLRDWIFTRQRYWGEPIPLIHCDECGIVPHDPEFAKYSNKEKEERPSVISKVTASSSTSPQIIASGSYCVKFKSKRRKNINREIENSILGKIKISRSSFISHLKTKSQKERTFRLKFFETIVDNLKNINNWENYNEVIVGGLNYKNLHFLVVVKSGELLTYYHSRKISKAWRELKQKYSLPLILPKTANYKPSESGESPLAKITDWVNTKCPSCGGKAKRETSTMPNWAGSSWYWLRFMDNNNEQEFCSSSAEKYWGPVDLYVGGAEHAVLHLLYARFWHKALYDLGLVSTKEPFKKLVNQGMIISYAYENKNGGLVPIDEVEEKNEKFFVIKTGEEVKKISAKMSKSLKNVVNPDEIVKKYGADTLRMYEMFMGPFEQAKVWDTGAVSGIRKFLDKVHRYFMTNKISEECPTKELIALTHQTVKIVGGHIDNFKFNTAISQMMVWINSFGKLDNIPKIAGGKFIRLLSPFAPHLAEEIWTTKFKSKTKTMAFETWPTYDEKLLLSNSVRYAVQINGKLRADFEIDKNKTKEDIVNKAKEIPNVAKWLNNKNIVKEIFVPGKIIGFVVK